MFDAAMEADEQGWLTEWVIEYLRQSGDNAVLARDLLRQGTYHTGLVDFPIEKLERLLGPNRSFDYYEEPAKYEHRVEAMVENIKNGWKPAPLIASRIWSDHFELNDGAHRAEALRRCGIRTYPTVFFFEDKTQFDNFLVSASTTQRPLR